VAQSRNEENLSSIFEPMGPATLVPRQMSVRAILGSSSAFRQLDYESAMWRSMSVWRVNSERIEEVPLSDNRFPDGALCTGIE
jgi:hypothetical protein